MQKLKGASLWQDSKKACSMENTGVEGRYHWSSSRSRSRTDSYYFDTYYRHVIMKSITSKSLEIQLELEYHGENCRDLSAYLLLLMQTFRPSQRGG